MESNQEPILTQDAPTLHQDRDAIFQLLESYDFSDPEFQAGIRSIVGPLQQTGASMDQILETQQRAKVFYFSSKTGHAVSYEEYVEWRGRNRDSAQPTNGQSGGDPIQHDLANVRNKTTTDAATTEPYPASFDSIVELITTGQTDKIPGIKDIPLKINEEEPTAPTLKKPPKPWEKVGAREEEEEESH
ncbi:hypothetical protein IE53DRAFT_312198 [Violaceomyces palustris]|uniref:Uncharacterized protein n=1 Tax=Violaceomyces palustris TaxID=1673888 RepID=A0ACD0P2Q9_9BASI|nr:hypothetical protein IE53DRAFT_312198 [Violaceomyces palustris]